MTRNIEGTLPRRYAAGGDVAWHRRNRARNLIAATCFVTPNVILYALFILVPTAVGVALGFFRWNMLTAPQFIGLENYRRLFSDGEVARSLWHTFLYLGLGLVPTILVGFMLAVLVNSRMRGVSVIRVAYFVPIVVSSAVSAVLWAWLYQPTLGIINRFLGVFGIDGPAWLTSTFWALPALTIMMIWLALPLVIILYLAGLQRIPESIYEAARIDGAGAWARLWLVTWPNVGSVTLLVLAFEFINFMSAPLELALIMTSGGPLDSTQALSLYIFKVAFLQADVGYACALSIVQFLIIVVVGGLIRSVHRLTTVRETR